MGVKRAHRKTRTGCKTCRNRRVKCDEVSPTCGNCFKRGVECIWAESPASSSSSSVASPGLQPTGPVHDTLGQSLTMHGASTIPLDLSTLELMHHYTNNTCFSHGYHPDVVEVWKTVAPTLAFSSQAHFLAHAILAISAAQLSQSHSEKTLSLKYAYAAASHFDNARRDFIAVLDATPDPDSLGISFLTHHLLAIYSFSTSKSLLSPEWVTLFRMHISPQKIAKMWSQYVKGPIGPLMLYLTDRHLRYVNPEFNIGSYPFPDYLSVIHLPNSGAPDSQEVLDPDVSELYAGAVESTRRAALISSDPHSDSQYVAWYMDVPYQFLVLLWARRPRALVIAAHYCAIMSHLKVHYATPWWIPGEQRWQQELSDIRREVGGDWDDWLPEDEQLAMTAWIG